jgi:hypothetical protein
LAIGTNCFAGGQFNNGLSEDPFHVE